MYTVKHILTDQEAVTLRDDLLEKYPLDPPADVTEPDPVVTDKPVPPPSGTSNYSFFGVWGRMLDEDTEHYGNKDLTVSKQALSISIPIPTLTRNRKLKITRLENTGQRGRAYGVLSAARDFSEPVYSKYTWGLGGGVFMTLTPEDSGKVFYFNMRMVEAQNNWRTTLQATFR